MDGYLSEITQVYYDQSWKNSNRRIPLGRVKSRFSDYRVRRSLRLMQKRFSEERQWKDRPATLGFRARIFQLFKKQMGITPDLYLDTLRAEHAIVELLNTDKSVTDIGFSSQASFTRFFGSNAGIFPSEYRRVAHRI